MATETPRTDIKVGTSGGKGGNGVRNLNKQSKSITKEKIVNSSRKKFLFKQGNILHYLEDAAIEGGRGTLMKKSKNKNKNMAVAHIRPILGTNHADFETSTIGTEVGGGMKMDRTVDEAGVWL